MSVWNILRIGASALDAQQLRLDTIANNIANAETTHTPEGGAYQRRDIVFMPRGNNAPFARVLNGLSVNGRGIGGARSSGTLQGVQASQVVTDPQPGPKVYDPTHPDADEQGYVTYPNVNMVVEMTNMLSASRSYEAGLSVVEAAKRMALRALDIGR